MVHDSEFAVNDSPFTVHDSQFAVRRETGGGVWETGKERKK